MRTTFTTRLFTVLSFIAVVTGCGLASDNSAARDVAAQFYDALKTGDVAKAASFCGTDDVMTTQAWQDLFSQNLNTMGKVTGYESKGGFNVSKEGGKSTVHVAYEVTYEYGKTMDSLIIISLGDGFKLYEYSPEIKEATFQKEYEKAKSIATEYMQALQASDYIKALGYIGYSGSAKHTADEWKNFYATVETSAGAMTSIELDNESSTTYLNDEHIEAGTGNVYSIIFTTYHNGISLSHQVDLFQPKFGDQLKIVAHNVK